MKALSVKYPWAAWLMDGSKTIEIRGWTTKHRGPLLIVSSLDPDWAACVPEEHPEWVYGAALGVVQLVDVRPLVREDVPQALCAYAPGRYAWVLEAGRRERFCRPFPVKGRLGLYEVALPSGTVIEAL